MMEHASFMSYWYYGKYTESKNNRLYDGWTEYFPALSRTPKPRLRLLYDFAFKYCAYLIEELYLSLYNYAVSQKYEYF